jgi:hypothetical protein
MELADEAVAVPPHVLAIAEGAVARSGRALVGPATVERHWGISTILSLPTDAGTLWFKHVPPIFAREGAITTCLARIVPDNLPRVIAWEQGWMLMEEFPACDSALPEHPLATLARVQIASTAHRADLAAAGCAPQPLDVLVEELARLEQHAPIMRGEQLEALSQTLQHVAEACDRMAALPIPTTIVHGDLHSGNAHRGPRGWILFDWTDAFLGNPFLDLVYPMVRQEPGAREAFQRIWLEALAPETVAHALALAPVVGAAHHIVMHGRIMRHVADPEPFRASLDMWLGQLIRTTDQS